MKGVEKPCVVDGDSCTWVTEQEYSANGSVTTDAYCEKCFRLRDWTKQEFKHD